ncbi:MAG: hypothetical protein RLZZ601_121 [Pseudomonadota bacterium]|jgi:hypothetical protein
MVGFSCIPTLPHLVFIESACPAFLSSYSKGNVFIYTNYSSQFAPDNQEMLVVSKFWMRALKILAALLRFPCTFQSGYELAYRLSKEKSVISDGLLTEWLHQRGHIQPKFFTSVARLKPRFSVKQDTQLILGSNWYEFGTLTQKKYEALLRTFNQMYPNANYFPHPKEDRSLARRIFEGRLIEASESIEFYCKKNGIPSHIIGIGSTAMASLGMLAVSNLVIELFTISPDDCDGPNGDVLDPFLLKKRDLKFSLSDLSEVIKEILKNTSPVTIKERKLLISD